VHFKDVCRTRLLVEHVDVLRGDPLHSAHIFEMLQSDMHRSRGESRQPVDEIGAPAVVDRWIAVEPVYVEDAFGIRLAVKPLRTAEIGNPAQSGNPGAGQAADPARIEKQFAQILHDLTSLRPRSSP
jgi:hypothetical protein